MVNIYEYDHSGKYIQNLSASSEYTPPANVRYVNFMYVASSTDIKLQFQESEITAYEPHKSAKLTTKVPVRRVPNGTADKIYEADGVVWKEKR